MANNVKPGQMAILINDEAPENIGAIVQVVERSPDWPLSHGVLWRCTTKGRPLLCLSMSPTTFKHDGTYERCFEFDITDCDLRPVSGLPLEDLVETSLVA